MPAIVQTDPRPKDITRWIEKYRKVRPIITGNPSSDGRSGEDGSQGRKAPVTSGLEPYSGPWDDVRIAHLLKRTMFGVSKADLDHFRSLNMDQAVAALLTSSPSPAIPVNNYEGIDSGANDPHVGLGETWITAPHAGDLEGYRIISLKGWLIRNMLTQERTIHEKMKFFWSNLLVTKAWDVYISKASYQYYKMLHNNALGNYRTLIRKLTLDPSMLIFLNGTFNNKYAPDENYGRELQELFSVGKGPDSHYTEDDVRAAARVLTGWHINWEAYDHEGDFQASFDPALHDTGDKQFSSFYDSAIIEGSEADGDQELDAMLDMIVGNEETARYICRRLYNFFVYSEVDDTTDENIIQPLAAILRDNNFEILPVLEALLKSAHFYASSNIGAQIKNPLDHLLGIWKCLALPVPAVNDYLTTYRMARARLWHMANMGLEVADPPNVAGWSAYYQAPFFDQAWITTDTITQRAVTTDSIIYWGFWIDENLQISADLLAFAETLDDPGDPNALIRESAQLFLGLPLSQDTVDHLKTILLSGQLNDGYWTGAWTDYVDDPDNEEYRQIVETRLQSMLRQLLQLGSYQLM